MQLEKIHELQDRLDEERENLRLLQQSLGHECVARAHGGGARERARDINRRIVEYRAVEPPVFGRASQNMVAAAMLLRNMPEPSNPEARRARDEIRGLLETAAMQQAKSSALRRHGLASEQPVEPSRQEREASVHPEHAQWNKAASVREHVVDNREPQDTRDNIIER
jgi:tyrosyl-tRNA synthetase